MKLIIQIDPTDPAQKDEAMEILKGSDYKIVLHDLYLAFRNKWKYSDSPPKDWDEVRELFFSVDGVAEAID